MNMKTLMNLLLMALLIGVVSLSVTSCKDDDKNSGGDSGGTELGPTETQEATNAYSWLINLTEMDDFTDDWASKTYEPSIGVESQTQPTVRIVEVSNLELAKDYMSSLALFSRSTLSTTQTATIDGVGTMTWTPSPAGANNLAVVDVNIKMIPHLTRIVFCTSDQVGSNGDSYSGTAYYRFGDVIEDMQGYYWVCVKAPFGTGQNPSKDGYWINIFNADETTGKPSNGNNTPGIPADNIYKEYDDQNKYNYNTILLPTKLYSTNQYVHALSNLLWALLDPEAYKKACETGNQALGLGNYEYDYNGAKFVKRIAEQWDKLGIWEKLFNRSYTQMKKFPKLSFYYKGYSWWGNGLGSTSKGFTWCHTTTKYMATGYPDEKQDKETGTYELVEAGAGFDIRRYCSDSKQNKQCSTSGKAGYAPALQFSDDQGGYWVVRQKTSKQLAGKKVAPDLPLSNMVDIYRYNAAYKHRVGTASAPETEAQIADAIDVKKVVPGNLLASDGNFYINANHCKQKDAEPIAIVAYVAPDNKYVEANSQFKGLCISLKKAGIAAWKSTATTDTCSTSFLSEFKNEPTIMDGLQATQNLNAGCNNSHTHKAATLCVNKDAPKGNQDIFSSWFMPSIGQFEIAVKTLGGFTWSSTNGFGSYSQKTELTGKLRKKFQDAGVGEMFDALIEDSPLYWTTTLVGKASGETDFTKAFTFTFQYFLDSTQKQNLSTFTRNLNEDLSCLPFIAFRYPANGQ